jgi:tubulin monoglycylase TTLL3/8
MIDEAFKVWLIEINTNPCLELSCNLLAKIIPAMIENAFRIAVDPLFPPPSFTGGKKPMTFENFWDINLFELVFDEEEEISQLRGVLNMNAAGSTFRGS